MFFDYLFDIFLIDFSQLYDEDVGKSGSRLCGCNAGPELKCTWLEEIEKKPCNTDTKPSLHKDNHYMEHLNNCSCAHFGISNFKIGQLLIWVNFSKHHISPTFYNPNTTYPLYMTAGFYRR